MCCSFKLGFITFGNNGKRTTKTIQIILACSCNMERIYHLHHFIHPLSIADAFFLCLHRSRWSLYSWDRAHSGLVSFEHARMILSFVYNLFSQALLPRETPIGQGTSVFYAGNTIFQFCDNELVCVQLL